MSFACVRKSIESLCVRVIKSYFVTTLQRIRYNFPPESAEMFQCSSISDLSVWLEQNDVGQS